MVITKSSELYRHFDKHGRLLYVGVALHTIARLLGHRTNSHWYAEIVRIQIERFPSRKAARDAEIRAIAVEKPLYNLWTETRQGIKARSDDHQREIGELIKSIEIRGYYPRRNLCLDALQTVLREIEAGRKPDENYLRHNTGYVRVRKPAVNRQISKLDIIS